MTARPALAALGIAVMLSISTAQGAIGPPPDDLSTAYDAALADLIAGKERQPIVDRLKPVVEKNADSPYHNLASDFLTDLVDSVINPPPADAEPERRLAETRIPYYMLSIAENWDRPLRDVMKKDPKDSACQLLARERTVIPQLIALLTDRSPTRANAASPVSGFPDPQPRVCDVALAIIEFHARCRFFHDSHTGRSLHQLPEEERKQVITRITDWWQECKDQSVAAGVRAQLPHARSYPEKVWMAKVLIQIGHEQKTDDKEFGLDALREMLQQYRRSHVGAYVAAALAEFGDTSAVDVFYDEWKSQPQITNDSGIAFYLCRYGQRREWELLYAISQDEIRRGETPSHGAVWACVINSGQAETNPYAIPILGLALGEQDSSQSFSFADKAADYLQKQIGQDFSYERGAAAANRLAAIRKAQKWWDEEGKRRYTFDYIGETLRPGKSAPQE